jgi:hypothetical protein
MRRRWREPVRGSCARVAAPSESVTAPTVLSARLSRVVSRTGPQGAWLSRMLEVSNRYSSLGGSRVRIPPPPLLEPESRERGRLSPRISRVASIARTLEPVSLVGVSEPCSSHSPVLRPGSELLPGGNAVDLPQQIRIRCSVASSARLPRRFAYPAISSFRDWLEQIVLDQFSFGEPELPGVGLIQHDRGKRRIEQLRPSAENRARF